MKKTLLILILSVAISTFAAVIITNKLNKNEPFFYEMNPSNSSVRNVSFSAQNFPDFTYAAENSVNGVVFVKVVKKDIPREASILEHFFGFGVPQDVPRASVNTGSGVIISPDGYIVTNNHVVEGGEDVEITLNDNKKYKAKIIGTDKVTDIALLKIDATDLQTIPFGDSNNLRLGEWVLAIGSPFNLRSTITAGIVSAKGRSLPSSSREFKIESFIQTDAAVNPGNSGGALVNVKGELVGINTAIASNTGSYTGYSFAVPVAIVKKVVDDIKNHGSVQRAVLGVSMIELTQELATEVGMEGNFSGVFIGDVIVGSAAQNAGIKGGDVIVAIDDQKMTSPSEVQATINGKAPGDVVKIMIYRDKKEITYDVELQGSNAIAEKNDGSITIFGATLKEANEDVLRKLRLKNGVEIIELDRGNFKSAGMHKGLIITHINQIPVKNAKEVLGLVQNAKRGLLVEGVSKSGEVLYFGVGI